MIYTKLFTFLFIIMTTFSGCDFSNGDYTPTAVDQNETEDNSDDSSDDDSDNSNNNSSSNNNSPSNPPATTTKIFNDSITSGISYTFDGGSGTSTSDGKITYHTGKTVTLKLGSVLLGTFSSTKQSSYIYPQDLVNVDLNDTNNSSVIKIAQLLQSLDSNQNPSDGIEINSSIKNCLSTSENIQSMTNSRLSTLITGLANCNLSLVDALTARNHLDSTMQANGVQPLSKIIPTIISITSTNNTDVNKTYIHNDEINITINFSENVYMNSANSSPVFTFTLGSDEKNATYLEGNGTSTFEFRYIIEADLEDTNGIVLKTVDSNTSIDLNTSIIQDGHENNLTNTFPTPDFTKIQVNSILPRIVDVTIDQNGTHTIGVDLNFSVNFNHNIDINGTPYLVLNIGGTDVNATLTDNNGTSLVFTYTVDTGFEDYNGLDLNTTLELNGTTIKNSFNNILYSPSFAGNAPDTSNINIDTRAPIFNTVNSIERCERKTTIDFNEINATDGNGSITYSIFDDENSSLFNTTITQNTGVMLVDFKVAPIYDENNKTFNIIVIATDDAGNESNETYPVTVLNKDDDSNLHIKYVVYDNNLTEDNVTDDTVYIYFNKKILRSTLDGGNSGDAGGDFNLSYRGELLDGGTPHENIYNVAFAYDENLFNSLKVYDNTNTNGNRIAFDTNGTSTDTNLSIKFEEIKDWDNDTDCQFYPTDYNQTVATKIEYVLKTEQNTKGYDNTGNPNNLAYYDDGAFDLHVPRNYLRSENNLTLIDSITSLEWEDNDDMNTSANDWDKLNEYCNDLTLDTHSDWRLPNIVELSTLISYRELDDSGWVSSNSVKIHTSTEYWSSSETLSPLGSAWYVNFSDNNGSIEYQDKAIGLYLARCVRNYN